MSISRFNFSDSGFEEVWFENNTLLCFIEGWPPFGDGFAGVYPNTGDNIGEPRNGERIIVVLVFMFY